MDIQQIIDDFYRTNGPCCAGCDSWRWINTLIGECIQSNLVSGSDKIAMLNLENVSFEPGAGHVLTPRGHYCGKFEDSDLENNC